MTQLVRPNSRDGFEIALVCALQVERDAIEALLEEDYEVNGFSYGKAVGDLNVYTTGRLGNQHVVLVYMPGIGTASAAAVAVNLKISFRMIRLCFVVGICGGMSKTIDGTNIFLGDVIISKSVVQIDYGRQYPNKFVRRPEIGHVVGQGDPELRAFIHKLSGHLASRRIRETVGSVSTSLSAAAGLSQMSFPGSQRDILYPAIHRHKHWKQDCLVCAQCRDQDDDVCDLALESSCEILGCGTDIGIRSDRILRSRTPSSNEDTSPIIEGGATPRPAVHFGNFVCSNTVIKSGQHRDRIATAELAIGFEMESAGTLEYIPTVVVKGVCDYADSHKNKEWQPYAALTAAACMKAILEEWRSNDSLLGGRLKRQLSGQHRFRPLHWSGSSIHDDNSGPYDANYPVHWTITRSKNALFTGREDELEILKGAIQRAMSRSDRRDPCRIVIYGTGGQGKSELCLQVAHRLSRLFWGIFWIDLSTTAMAESGFSSVATRLNVRVNTCWDVRHHLANLKLPWLLVLDNADDPDVDYQEYLPPGPSGVVILTSRNSECRRYAETAAIELPGLSVIDARELLLKGANVSYEQHVSHENDADAITKLLNLHPLAITQAAAYISHGHCSLSDYPGQYRQYRKRVLAYKPSQGRSRHSSVYATFDASAARLQARDEQAAHDALELLSIFGLCAPSRLPLILFEAAWIGTQQYTQEISDFCLNSLTRWHLARLPSFLQVDALEWDSFRLKEAVRLLKAGSLVVTDDTQGVFSVSMHPLIHAWAKDRLNMQQQHESWVSASCLIAVSIAHRSVWSEHNASLRFHLQNVLSWNVRKMFDSEPQVMICRLLLICGFHLIQMGDSKNVYQLVEAVLPHLGLDPLVVTLQWLDLYDLIALAFSDHGKGPEAIAILKQVVQLRRESHSLDSSDLIVSQIRLGRVFRKHGQAHHAVSMLEEVVQVLKTISHEDGLTQPKLPDKLAKEGTINRHAKGPPSVASPASHFSRHRLIRNDSHEIQFELAKAYKDDMQLEKAITMLVQLIQLGEHSYSASNPNIMQLQREVAAAYEINGQLNEAILLLEQVVKKLKDVTPVDHLHLLFFQHQLAATYLDCERTEEAVRLLEQIIGHSTDTLGAQHPDTLSSQHELARAYLIMGHVQRAVPLLQNIVRIESKTLAEQDVGLLASQHELARAYHANCRFQEAVTLLERVVRIRSQSLPEDSHDLMISQAQLASSYYEVGRHVESSALLQRVSRVLQQHPDRYFKFRTLIEERLRNMAQGRI